MYSKFNSQCQVSASHCVLCIKKRFMKKYYEGFLETCIDGITQDSVEILGSTSKGEVHLLTLEALWIRELKPFLNTQDTMRSRDLKLTIKF